MQPNINTWQPKEYWYFTLVAGACDCTLVLMEETIYDQKRLITLFFIL